MDLNCFGKCLCSFVNRDYFRVKLCLCHPFLGGVHGDSIQGQQPIGIDSIDNLQCVSVYAKHIQTYYKCLKLFLFYFFWTNMPWKAEGGGVWKFEYDANNEIYSNVGTILKSVCIETALAHSTAGTKFENHLWIYSMLRRVRMCVRAKAYGEYLAQMYNFV